ncbi:MAG: UDP-N-acetylmuramoyl-L-alanyl-D-glutamate--2,6-diaminopimelate ligase [Cystobacterineae bacterium]|nr:UDP-N-acetylmuramoyl-L-alanyl-D-glutamate--2,6-diaminopimelate ligase [Cystobacterineae bacterium]
MKLKELLAGTGVDPALSSKVKAEIQGLCTDSRQVKEGELFIALPGVHTDGIAHIAEAINRGAVAVLSEKELGETKIPALVVSSARKALAVLAANYYGRPADALDLIGVTGTNGKTTVAWLVESICAAGGSSTGLLGTIANRYAGNSFEPNYTTAEPIELQGYLRKMVDADIETVVMEVSSHALAQERVHGLTFRSAAFMNLSRDHLDYHRDMEEYFQAKRKLFSENLSSGGVAVVSAEDSYALRIFNEFRVGRRTAWKFSMAESAELFAANTSFSAEGIVATLKTPAGDIPIKSHLIGAHNLENILAAAGLTLSLGFSRKDVQVGVESMKHIPGRMEKVVAHGVTALVDFAHTELALRSALLSARKICTGKLTVVFGCAGERDHGKRPLMGEVAAEVADLPILTTDNSRSEDAEDIVSEIVPGLEKHNLRRVGVAKIRSGERGYVIELNRAQAIQTAISLAKPGDVILIAGKGHERHQEQEGIREPFDDLEEARKALQGIS